MRTEADSLTLDRVFRYHLAWYTWILMLAMVAWAASCVSRFIEGQAQSGAGESAYDVTAAAVVFLCSIAFPLAFPVGATLLVWRGFVAVGSDGVSWRQWRGRHFRSWDGIVAVSRLALSVEAQALRGPMTIRLVRSSGYSNIYAYCLEDAEEVARSMAQWGGLTDETELMGRRYYCLPGWKAHVTR